MSGIIINTFVILRLRTHERVEDMYEICFMCGNSREIFDRNTEKGFEYHIRNEHYMWNYVFFIFYLESIPEQSMNGIESYIFRKASKFELQWMPIY